MTLRETSLMLTEGITIGGKPLKDHFEIVDNDKAYQAVLDLVEDKTPLTVGSICSIHRIAAYNDHDAQPIYAIRLSSY